MDSISKSLSLLLIVVLLIASSLLIIQFADAQTIPKPSVPEFSLQYADHSYDMPPKTTSTFNPYNNKTTENTIPGYQVQNFTIDLKIRNQPIPSMIDGNKSFLLFNIRLKGYYGTNWVYPYGYGTIDSYPVQSDSDYTVISIPATIYNVGDEIDFQMQAILAYGYNHSLTAVYPVYVYDYEAVASSDWSPVQTIAIPSISSVTPTESLPNMGPTSPPNTNSDLTITLTWIIVGILVISVISLLLYVRHLRKINQDSKS
jgi:hypothetical protein